MLDKTLHFAWVYAADALHLSAVGLLVGWILHKKTCKGISGRTQIMAALVDFFQFAYAAGTSKNIYEESPDYYSVVTTGLSSTLSATLLYLMYAKYKHTIEKDYDTFWIELFIIICGGIALVANPVYMDTPDKSETDPLAVVLYTSIYLDSVSILPQIYFNFRTGSKQLCMTLYVLLSALSTFFYMYYLVTAVLDTTDIEDPYVFDRLEEKPKYTVYPECVELGTYLLFFVMLVVVPKYEKIIPLPLSEVESTTNSSIDGENTPSVIVVTRPQLDRQQSRLETPFLKKSLPSSSSLVSPSPDGSRRLGPVKPWKPNITRMMQLTHLKRARTSSSSLWILGTASAPSTPEDEGFMLFKETAIQSRKRRQEYNRRRSLPTTSSEPSSNKTNKKVIFQIGENDVKSETTFEKKHKKTTSFDNFLAEHKLKFKQASINLEENIKNIQLASQQTVTIPNKDEPQQETLDGNKKIVLGNAPKPSGTTLILSPKTLAPSSKSGTVTTVSPKASKAQQKKSRRVTVYQYGPHNPHQIQNNWKLLATNFLGTGPQIGMRRPSMEGLPEQRARPHRQRIFSVV